MEGTFYSRGGGLAAKVLVVGGLALSLTGAIQVARATNSTGACLGHLVHNSSPTNHWGGTHCDGACVVGTCKFLRDGTARSPGEPAVAFWRCGCDLEDDFTGACDILVTAKGGVDPNATPNKIAGVHCQGTCPGTEACKPDSPNEKKLADGSVEVEYFCACQ